MKIKQPIAILAALALNAGVRAQSLEEGVRMYQYERYESAKKALTPLAASNTIANYYLGLAELGLEHNTEARNIFTKYPDDAANMAGLARVAYVTANIPEGNRLTGIVAAKAGKKAWEPLKYAADAITYTEGGNKQQAIDWYKEALKRNENIGMRISLGDAYQQIPGGGGEAMNNYEKVTMKDPGNSLAFSRIGALWYASKRYDLALENYQKAKTADPTNPLPYRDLANAYYWTGKYDLAKQNIEKYLELSDKSPTDEKQYLDLLYLSKDYNNAVQKALELLGSGQTNPGIYGILAYSSLEIKDCPKALEYGRVYLRMQDPKRILYMDYVNYGRIMACNNLADSADYYFDKAIAADTSVNKLETYRKIAEAFRVDLKDYAKAARWYDRLIKACPQAQAIDYFWRGTMYYYAKDYSNAAKAFEEMETKFPDQPSATYWRGRVAAAQDEEGKSGIGAPFYEKWLGLVGPNYEKKNDLMQAYQYLALYYYNKGDKEKTKEYMDKIELIDPANSFLKQLKDLRENENKPKPARR